MKRLAIVALVFLGLAAPSKVFAAPISLQEILFNLDGTQYHDTFAVPGLNSGAFDTAPGGTGLGTLQLTLATAGAHFFDVFFDHQAHVTYYNEYGAVGGSAGAGISWQIDEPGWGDKNRLGTIFTNTSTNSLDNTNHLPGTLSNFDNDCGANGGGAVNANCNNDASMAMGFNLFLGAGEVAVITLNASQSRPNSGFFLQQHDPDSPVDDVFLTGTLCQGAIGACQGEPEPPTTVPEPASLLLLGTGLIGIARRVLRKKASTSPSI